MPCEPPRLCELLARDNEAVFDPLDACCLATRSGTCKSADRVALRAIDRRALRLRSTPASRRWGLRLLVHCGTQGAEILAEAPHSGFEPRDPAQQTGSTEIGVAHAVILSKSAHRSKWSKCGITRCWLYSEVPSASIWAKY